MESQSTSLNLPKVKIKFNRERKNTQTPSNLTNGCWWYFEFKQRRLRTILVRGKKFWRNLLETQTYDEKEYKAKSLKAQLYWKGISQNPARFEDVWNREQRRREMGFFRNSKIWIEECHFFMSPATNSISLRGQMSEILM